ncbi:hypothetical protein OsJ_06253 [Oryza sativa Japonica Group]|uniref:Uncharacterized protein n=2 Tax=Oryza TaxID=4527 RepID=A3A5J6_ORYSJ|nr:hypothetical protein OsJ_06253 [Oryza sativa Japonica Group]
MEKIHSQFRPRCTRKIREKRRQPSRGGAVEVAAAVTDLWASSHHQAAIVTITEQRTRRRTATPEITSNGSTPPEPIGVKFASLDLVAVVTVAIVAVVGAIVTCSRGREAGGSREGPG